MNKIKYIPGRIDVKLGADGVTAGIIVVATGADTGGGGVGTILGGGCVVCIPFGLAFVVLSSIGLPENILPKPTPTTFLGAFLSKILSIMNMKSTNRITLTSFTF